MLNSKIEKVLIIILLYIFLIVPALIVPVQNPNLEIKLQYCILSFLLTVFVFWVYKKISTNYVHKKIRQYWELNQYENACEYIEKCMKKNRKIAWLKFEKLFLIALQGKITDFRTYDYELKKNYYTVEKKYSKSTIQFEKLFYYISDNKLPEQQDVNFKNATYLDIIIWLLSEKEQKNFEEIKEYLFMVYNSPYLLYKSVSAFLISEQYQKIKDYDNANLFMKKAKQYAPSNEIKYFFEKRESIGK